MSKKIRVFLLEDVETYGKAGDIIEATEGYARNFLFPQGKAALATTQVEKKAKEKKSKEVAAAKEDLAKHQRQADELDGTELIISARIKDGDEIYGKITARDIVKALKTQADLTISTKEIGLSEPITTIGSHNAIISLAGDVEANIRVTVEPEAGSQPKNYDQ